MRAAAPDFWKDQAEAQKIQQRRRRVEQVMHRFGAGPS